MENPLKVSACNTAVSLLSPKTAVSLTFCFFEYHCYLSLINFTKLKHSSWVTSNVSLVSIPLEARTLSLTLEVVSTSTVVAPPYIPRYNHLGLLLNLLGLLQLILQLRLLKVTEAKPLFGR